MTHIEWTNEVWNPTTGCDKVSQGCKNCYAEKMHNRLMAMFPKKYSQPFLGHLQMHDAELQKPLKWKQPKMIFVNSMSDLFHKDVDPYFIAKVFDIMRRCPQHTFQILTKRSDRMLRVLGGGTPLPNVWLGVSCEDQKTAGERIPDLFKTPAAKRFISCEPLLGPINLTNIVVTLTNVSNFKGKGIDWVIAGGESGHKARPMHPAWVRGLRDQCSPHNTPFFFKQWGEWVPVEPDAQAPFLYFSHNNDLVDGHHVNIVDPIDPLSKPGRYLGYNFMDPFEAIDICTEHNDSPCDFWHIGKARAGNFLDGKQHLEFPKP